jgi:hypothetical protein
MRKQLILSALLPAFASTHSVRANDDGSSPAEISGRCFYGSKSFASETPILIGDAIYVCGGDHLNSKWVKSDRPIAVNCLFDDSYYAPGSIVSIPNAKAVIICKSNGIWEQSSGK